MQKKLKELKDFKKKAFRGLDSSVSSVDLDDFPDLDPDIDKEEFK